jgi:hypothetical protein
MGLFHVSDLAKTIATKTTRHLNNINETTSGSSTLHAVPEFGATVIYVFSKKIKATWCQRRVQQRTVFIRGQPSTLKNLVCKIFAFPLSAMLVHTRKFNWHRIYCTQQRQFQNFQRILHYFLCVECVLSRNSRPTIVVSRSSY